jgi:DNA-directed RNA polymerase subunit H (RpoH/RPB5)
MLELLDNDGTHEDVIYIIDTNSDKIRRMPEMKKLLNSTRPQEGRTLREVIVFASSEHISKSNVRDTISGVQHQTGALFRGLNMTILSVNIPQQNIVPEHSVVAEPTALLKEIRRSAGDLRRISVNDPPVVWCGGKVGDIIRVKRQSENSLYALSYSVVY